ncbi:MAG: molybdopterin synthase sulfur carrier subunit [SAR324 cluster bacterium]|nr:molybdopterin synthase sulfur carrier subunit [SAR324 cluster bacterium]
MKITLVAYAVIKDAFPENPMDYEITQETTAAELMTLLAKDFPEISTILPYTRLGHQDEYVSKTAKLTENNTYFLIPPVSGG